MATHDSDIDQGIQEPSHDRPTRRDDDVDDHAYPSVGIDRPPSDNYAMALIAHLSGFVAGPIVPIIFYVVEKDKRSFLAWHSREALNFQLTLLLYYFAAGALFFLAFVDEWYLWIALFALVAVSAFEVIAMIALSVAAALGKRYRYPLTIPFVPRPSDEPNTHVDRE